jgi:hypothetical protein
VPASGLKHNIRKKYHHFHLQCEEDSRNANKDEGHGGLGGGPGTREVNRRGSIRGSGSGGSGDDATGTMSAVVRRSRDGRGRRSGRAVFNQLEVGARQAGGIAVVDDDGAVAKEGANTLEGGSVGVGVGELKGAAAFQLAVLAAQVADLAGFGGGAVTSRILGAAEGVQMGEGGGAVAVDGGGSVQVVREGTTLGRQVLELDGKLNATATGRSDGLDEAPHIALDVGTGEEGLIGKSGAVTNTLGVIGDSNGVLLSQGLTGEDSKSRNDDRGGKHLCGLYYFFDLWLSAGAYEEE